MNLGKLMTYGINSHVPLTTWLHKVLWQTKNKIFIPPEELCLPSFAGCCHMVRWSLEGCHTTLVTWLQEITFQLENLISPFPQDLHHHTWQGGDVLLFGYVALWRHMNNLKRNLNSSAKIHLHPWKQIHAKINLV